MSTILTLLAADEQSVYLGPEMGTLKPDEIPTTMFLPRAEYVAMGEPPFVTVTIEPFVPEGDPEGDPGDGGGSEES